MLHGGPIYPGYARAVNALVLDVIQFDPQAEWFVTGGDDVEPDMNHTAEEIARHTGQFFAAKRHGIVKAHGEQLLDTFGVMQPTGDRFAGGSIDRICGSPWMGREFCKRVNGGRGPLWPEYPHMFVDNELQLVAQKLGVFQQRPDLIHLHHHFTRATTDLHSGTKPSQIPAHLLEANSQQHWQRYQALFNARQGAGFPGHEPLPVAELAAQ